MIEFVLLPLSVLAATQLEGEGRTTPFPPPSSANLHHQIVSRYEDRFRLTQGEPSERAVTKALKERAPSPLRNIASQIDAHRRYFEQFTATPRPPRTQGPLAEAARASGGWGRVLEEALAASIDTFGSGWVWIVRRGGSLSVWKGHDADHPLQHGLEPLIAIDLWEHAYLLDYGIDRSAYFEALIRAVDFEVIERRFQRISP